MNNADDKFVSNRVFYGDSTYVYEDAAKTKKVSAEVLADAFVKGMIVVVSGEKFVPVSIKSTAAAEGAVAYETITYIGASSGSPALKTLRSTNA